MAIAFSKRQLASYHFNPPMPGPPLKPIQTSQQLPQKVDAVVIGGGVIGMFTALELHEAGYLSNPVAI